MDRVALGQFFLSHCFGFPPLSTIPPVIHTRLHLLVALNGRILGTTTSIALPEIGERWIEECFLFLVFRRPANLLKHNCIGAANVMFRSDIFFAHKMTRVV